MTSRGAAGVATTIACAVASLPSCVGYLDAHYGYGADGGAPSGDANDESCSDDGSCAGEASDDGDADDGPTGDAVLPDGAGGGIVFHGETQSGATYSLDAPPKAVPGDLLIAGLFFGNVSGTGGTTVKAPPGWTELGQTVIAPDDAALYVYWTVDATTLTWPAQWQPGDTGAAWLLAYGGVDTTSAPAFVANQPKASAGGAAWPSPVLSRVDAGDVVVATFGGWSDITDAGAPTTWTLPSPWKTRSKSLSDGVRRSGVVGDLPVTGTTFSLQVIARASGSPYPQYVTAGLVTLKPLP
jgi:hypothetical protein